MEKFPALRAIWNVSWRFSSVLAWKEREEITLSSKTLSGESDEFFEKWRKFRPTNSFARRKFRQFRPTKSFAWRKISPIRIFCTKVSSVLNGPLLVLLREVLWKWLVYLCDSWYTQNSLKLEGSYSSDKSDDWVNLPQFVWGTVFASYHSFKTIY